MSDRPDDHEQAAALVQDLILALAGAIRRAAAADLAEIARLKSKIERLEADVAALKPAAPAAECTGLSAVWCPVHGECTCRNREDSMSDDDCPLHSPSSDHH